MSLQNFGILACLEEAEKFVVVGWWSRPVLGFSFSQAEQYWWHWVCGGGGDGWWWWSKVIFVTNTTFELSCGWVGSVTIVKSAYTLVKWWCSKSLASLVKQDQMVNKLWIQIINSDNVQTTYYGHLDNRTLTDSLLTFENSIHLRKVQTLFISADFLKQIFFLNPGSFLVTH